MLIVHQIQEIADVDMLLASRNVRGVMLSAPFLAGQACVIEAPLQRSSEGPPSQSGP